MVELRTCLLMLFGVLLLLNTASATKIEIIKAQGCNKGGFLQFEAKLMYDNGAIVPNNPIDLTIYDALGKDLTYGTVTGTSGIATWTIGTSTAGAEWDAGTYNVDITAVTYSEGDETVSTTVDISPKPTPTPTPIPDPNYRPWYKKIICYPKAIWSGICSIVNYYVFDK
ncbi:MAG: hypothetical protein ABIG96_06790 [Candidatus Micrarchaeota archaeon]